ncbi:DNA polymerase I [Iamia majanohamensis]|uniref:DNA polymerase I n=1 Tax=Iamia majanohamensis TaxID=467976 RepID=A0AAE9Y9G7_9ACTN|nr:DNA polymerase I [Iamia majanohamensis]WCO69057.1 DNA polymerase I [Iamia majanohamensis]
MALMLIDGNSLTYRAFFALPTDLTTGSGQVTNAVFGFTSMLVNLLRDHQPEGVLVAFDRPEPTFRHEAVPTYKAGRAETPDILRQQMGLVRQVIDSLAIPTLEQAGVEADDIIATLATRARDAGRDVLVVTGDRDCYQLVEDPHVKVLYNRRGVSDYALYDEAGIEERTGVRPDHYVLYAALRGDPSDNLPGVPGVGEKTAAKLINGYGTLDELFAHLDDQTPKLRQNLGENEAQARTNAEMMVLRRDVDLPLDLDDIKVGEPDVDEVKRLFEFLEFRSLWDRLVEAMGTDLGALGQEATVLEAEVVAPTDATDAVGRVEGLAATGGDVPLAASAGFDGVPRWDADPAGVALVADAGSGEVLWLGADLLADPSVRGALAGLLGDEGRPLLVHDAKPLLRWLARTDPEGRPVSRVARLRLDTALAAYLLDPAEGRYDLAPLLARLAHAELATDDDAPPEGQLDLDAGSTEDPEARAARAACRTALGVAHVAEPLTASLDAQGLRALHDDIEAPTVAVLAAMELVGVGVDRERLTEINERMRSEVLRLQQAIVEDAGKAAPDDFNVNSTPQLRQVLFGAPDDEEAPGLGLTPQKKTKTGFSTDAQTLEKLLGEHPIIEHLLAYREVEKLRSTYGVGLLAEVGPDDRIHATFNQTVARTGRLSSDAPNLHNIPVRSDQGRAFRTAFIPSPGCDLLVADYNQIELRCIAHLADDPGLVAAFTEGTDIHTTTAARVFSVAEDEVTPAQRAKAKMVSYGLAYGMEAYGLSQRLAISVEEARLILTAYFEAFPAVKDYMDRTVAEARERGYTETLFGRRRPIPELQSGNRGIRMAGERQAMNAGIQGLAADIFKVALVRLDRALAAQGARSRLILQVHDEVILDVVPDEHDDIAPLTIEVMRGAAELRVPLEVNLAFGATWADAK